MQAMQKCLMEPRQEEGIEQVEDGQIEFDRYDRLVYLSHLRPMNKGARPFLEASATALYEEGSRGPFMRRTLSRECVLARTDLRYRQFLANAELERFSNGESDARRVEVLERAVNAAHVRFVTAIRALDLVDCGFPAPINVTARNAVVSIHGRTDA
jgi:hypothetical protein